MATAIGLAIHGYGRALFAERFTHIDNRKTGLYTGTG